MASLKDTVKIPKIDFSNPDLIPGTPTWDLVRHDVFKALQGFGCFECIHETLIPSDLYTRLLEKDGLLEKLFNLPHERKQRFVDPRKPFHGHGYIGDFPNSPLVEFMGISEVLESPAIKNLTDLLWPSRFSESLVAYGEKLHELDLMLKMMFFQELDVEKYFETHINSTDYSLRMNKYTALNMDKDELAHFDMNFLTILQQNHVDGLEVQTKDGLWFKVSLASSPSSFIVFAGELLLAWSNGRIHCARHRVNMSCDTGETRYSIGLFSSFKGVKTWSKPPP